MQKPKDIFGEQKDMYLRPEITFPLTAEKDEFADWLSEKLSLQFHPKAREALNEWTPDGRFSTLVKQYHQGPLLGLQKEFPGFGWVLFELMPISKNRVEVAVTYIDKTFMQMAEILEMIATAYSESSDPIHKYLTLTFDIPIRQLMTQRLLLSQEVITSIENIGAKLQNAGIKDGKSLTVYQMDLIVRLALYSLFASVRELHFECTEHNTGVLYTITVWQDAKSCQVFLGVYSVFQGANGIGLWGWQSPLPEVDDECQRLRGLIQTKITVLESNLFYVAYMRAQKNASPENEISSTNTAPLPKIEDPTDQRLWDLIKVDPSITDTELAQKLGNIGRQAINSRRQKLKAMGYQVRVSRQK